ncbi:MAG TPA: acyl carrier protein [Anaerolineales bacterium]|nr:acyl carrier protein [Anaerolineales bacterium]
MDIPPKNPMPFEDFKRILAEELQIEESKIVPESTFLGDLLIDSIKLVELMLRLEEMGLTIPLEAAWDVETVGDAYNLYAQQIAP